MAKDIQGASVLEVIDDLSSNPLKAALEDEWVLYHGTSESYSASIQAFGLGHVNGTPGYWDDVQAFISYWRVFDLQSPAFSALSAFSQAQGGIRSVSLAATFERAARYAIDEPGGETIALLSRAIGQIAAEIRNPSVLANRLQEKRTRLYQLALRHGFPSEEAWDTANGASGSSLGAIDYALSILEDPSALFSELDRFESYSSGGEHAPVVYAVTIRSEDNAFLALDPAGINYRGILPPERLLARVQIAGDRVIRPRGPDHVGFDPELEAMGKWRERLGP